MSHPALPPNVSRPWLLGALCIWVLAALSTPAPAALPVEPGPFNGDVALIGDVNQGEYGPWALGRIGAGDVLVDFEADVQAGRGDRLVVSGSLDPMPGSASGRGYGAVLTVREIVAIDPSRFLPHRAGRAVRDVVEDRLSPFDDGRALLAGFLIGETSRISEIDVDAMRRSGLAHFVAVSGSNVALFLGLLAVVSGPLALGPKRRALVGLAGLPVYAAATRFEPSVLRASVMAGIALAGRLLGLVLEAWQLLSVAVVALLAMDPVLTSNVGFQLSVAATAGVLVGARWPARGRVARALGVTLGAQLAVAPLLLLHFGSVPLLSPIVNLVAAPLVATSTVMGAVGVAGVTFLVEPASWMADLVLALARGAAAWPQMSGWEILALLSVVVCLRLAPGLRPLGAIACSGLLVLALVSPGESMPEAGVVVLDVGQGDAILIHGGGGQFALVDGGPDEAALIAKLSAYGVRSLELMVLTHVHADHATGLHALVGRIDVQEVWADPAPHSTGASARLLSALEMHGVPVVAPNPGSVRRIGALELLVVGPIRRYASPNDQSIVLMVSGPTETMLLSGDIETHAQADLKGLTADVLKVPHQGAATSDAGWLEAVDPDMAVISVGPNQFGHPAGWVVDLLARDAVVRRTDEEGDIAIDLAG